MLVGIGLDLVDIERIESIVKREEDSFLRLLLSERERLLYDGLRTMRRRTEWLAGRFAAKEAASKALGTGFSGIVTPAALEIVPDSNGKPELVLPEAVVCRYPSPLRTHVTITHSKHTAAAVVLVEMLQVYKEEWGR
jgi:holo-[acyl-carrier protein] synthase